MSAEPLLWYQHTDFGGVHGFTWPLPVSVSMQVAKGSLTPTSPPDGESGHPGVRVRRIIEKRLDDNGIETQHERFEPIDPVPAGPGAAALSPDAEREQLLARLAELDAAPPAATTSPETGRLAEPPASGGTTKPKPGK